MKKKVFAMLLAGMTVMAVAAPMTVSAEEPAYGVGNEDLEWFPKGSKVGLSVVTLGSEFFSEFDRGMEAYFKDNGYDYVCVSNEGNAATQVSDIENLINMQCDAIALFVNDQEAVTDILTKAVAEGIQVYPISVMLEDPDTYTYCWVTDQYQSGYGAAQMAADWIEANFPDAEDGSIEVAVIGDTATSESSKRTDGLMAVEEITTKAKVVEMFDLTGASDYNIKSQEYADVISGKYPDCKVILSYSADSELGANEVYMRDASLDREHFAIFGVDTSQLAYQNIQASKDNESLIRGTVSLGDDLALDAYCLITGQYNDLADENNYISTPVTCITPENVDAYLE